MSFPTTHWSALAAASLDGAPAGREMLETFCQKYRPAVLEFVRFHGSSGEDPEDVTQEFFLRLLESRAWKRADRKAGKFRNFLLGSLKHHLADVHRRRLAGKRGAGAVHVPLDELGEGQGGPAAASAAPEADAVFDRSWACAVAENALNSVAAAMEEEGRGGRFERLAAYLQAGTDNPPYEALAKELGLTEGGVKTEVRRLRQRFRQALRAEVARTVAAPHEIDAEMKHLHAVLAAPDGGLPRTGGAEAPPSN